MRILFLLIGSVLLACGTQPSVLAQETHPNLLVDQARLDEIALAIQQSNSTHQEIYGLIKAEVDATGAFTIGGGNRLGSNWNYGRAFWPPRQACCMP